MNQTKIDDRMMTIELWIVASTTILFLFCQHPPHKGVLKYMAEAIISRRGWPEDGKPIPPQLITQTITGNTTNWVVPNIRSNISVLIFGGGGGGGEGGGGGGGWMNNGEFRISNGTKINIIIGLGGTYGNSGGTTSFGTYLSANGGGAGGSSGGGSGGSGGGAYGGRRRGGTGYQFGGGAGGSYGGGDGGPWGGGGSGWCYNGGEYGGGNGGKYGGGGATYWARWDDHTNWSKMGIGGQYGGNGGLSTIDTIVLGNMGEQRKLVQILCQIHQFQKIVEELELLVQPMLLMNMIVMMGGQILIEEVVVEDLVDAEVQVMVGVEVMEVMEEIMKEAEVDMGEELMVGMVVEVEEDILVKELEAEEAMAILVIPLLLHLVMVLVVAIMAVGVFAFYNTISKLFKRGSYSYDSSS